MLIFSKQITLLSEVSMQAYVEHANLTVSNIDDTIRFIQTAIPDFRVRHQGCSEYRWAHIGTQRSYIALQEVTARKTIDRSPYVDVGINHIGLVVDDVHSIIERLNEAGYQQNEIGNAHPFRRRAYYFDPNGVEWEFIEYLSEADDKRNDYTL